jgi:hypothetical protein
MWRTGERHHARTAALVLAVWVPWQNLTWRTLGETFSTLAVLAALHAWERPHRSDVAVGLAVGAAMVLRYPAALFALPFVCAYVLARDARGCARFVVGVGCALLVLGVADAWMWGRPWHSLLAYADYNLVRDRARIDYGARPLWYYVPLVVALAPVAFVVASVVRASRPRASMALALALSYLGVMSLLAHKEPRFALPAVPLLVIAAASCAPSWSSRGRAWLGVATLAHGVAALVLYAWSGVCEGDATRAAMWVGRQRDAGALVHVGVAHPGYVVLHREVPVYGDARGDVARSLAMITRVPHGLRVYAVCQRTRWRRSTGCVEALRARWGAPVHREGDAWVFDVTPTPVPRRVPRNSFGVPPC